MPQVQADPNAQPMPNPGEPMSEAHATDPETPIHGAEMTNDEAQADTLRMLTPHDALRAHLTGLACGLAEDELRVLTSIAQRLKGGQSAYGRLCLATDSRQFRAKEAREEVEDALVYLACAWLQNQEVN